MQLYFIGDIHGLFTEYYLPKLNMLDDRRSIQLGDMGIGFPNYEGEIPRVLPALPKNHTFIRGNHDNPEICKQHPNYMGDFGYDEELDMFYIGGAQSIDKAMRTDGIDWWHDEELSMGDCYDAMELYQRVKPRIVVSHDCPEAAKIAMSHKLSKTWFVEKSRTNQILQAMFEIHQPSIWMFGHYHMPAIFKVTGIHTYFQCVDKEEMVCLDI